MLTHHEQFERRFEKLVVYAHTSRMLDWREWVLDNCAATVSRHRQFGSGPIIENRRTILDITPDVDLAQGDLHVLRARVCEHDKFDVGGSLIVMELVLRCTIGQEALETICSA